MTPFIGIETIEVSSTILIIATAEISVHRKPEWIVTGRVSNGNCSVGMVSNILFEIPLDRLNGII